MSNQPLIESPQNDILQYKYVFPSSESGAVRLSFKTPAGRWVNQVNVSQRSTPEQIACIIAAELEKDKLCAEDISYFVECWHLSKGKKHHRTTLNTYRSSVSGHPGVWPIAGSGFVGFSVHTVVADKIQEYGGRYKVDIAVQSRTVTVSESALQDAFYEACVACDTIKGRHVYDKAHYLKMMKPIDWVSYIKREAKIDVRRLVFGDVGRQNVRRLPANKLHSAKKKKKKTIRPAFKYVSPKVGKRTLGFKTNSGRLFWSCYPYPFGEGFSFSSKELERLFVEACRHVDQLRGKALSDPAFYLKGLEDIDWQALAKEADSNFAGNFVITKRAMSNYRVGNKHFRTVSEASEHLGVPVSELKAISGENGVDFIVNLPGLLTRIKKEKKEVRIYVGQKVYVGLGSFCNAYGLSKRAISSEFAGRDVVRFTKSELKTFWLNAETRKGYFVGTLYYPSITAICDAFDVPRYRVMHLLKNNVELTALLMKRMKG